MASNYHLLVKKSLDQNQIEYVLPEYIQRGWKRIYTSEEKQLIQRSPIIGIDVQIPNSVVRQRLGTTEILKQAKIKLLQKAFELPNDLFLNLLTEHERIKITDEEKISLQWNDDDYENNRRKSTIQMIIDKQREKRRKLDEYKYDYENLEPLSLDEILEEIQTNIGKDLKSEDMKLINELMQIINQHKNTDIMNIYDQLIDIELISKFGGIPKLVQALQEIQKAFEKIAMKTNVASIETIINVLIEKDNTYRIAVELLKTFNENTKQNKFQQNLYLIDRSDDISDQDHKIFNILIKDRINRLSTSDLTMLIRDLAKIRTVDISKSMSDRDEQVKYIVEQLNFIFTRAHLNGLKTSFDAMKSPISISLREFLDKVETSIQMKLTEQDNIFIESFINDYLSSLNENQLKTINERLAQQGTLKRLTDYRELNQAITMSLMKKIHTDGLPIVIDDMKDAHIDIHSFDELLRVLELINQHIQNQSSISIEQIQNQLDIAYFIETHRLTKQQICELAKSINLYSIAEIFLSEEPTIEECKEFLERLKVPFVRMCMKRSLETITNTTTNNFYRECVENLLNEFIHGSNEFNRNVLSNLIQKQFKKSKDLPEKIYRQMLKEKLIQLDTDKKKNFVVIDGINQILTQENDPIKQNQLIEIFEKVGLIIPERVKYWYKNKLSIQNSRRSKTQIKKNTIKQRPLPVSNKSEQLRKSTIEQNKSILKTIKHSVKSPSSDITTPNKLHEISISKSNQSFQVEIETIHPETITTNGIMGENNAINFEINQISACLQYESMLLTDPDREIKTVLIAQTCKIDLDVSYEKTKAQRILAKTIGKNISESEIKSKSIDGNLSLTSLPIKSEDQILLETTNRSSIDLSAKNLHRTSLKSLKQSDNIYINSLTKSLNTLLTTPTYNNEKLRKIHDELIASGLISPLNEFYRSTNDALRVILDHCLTYDEFIKWTLALLQTTNKPNLIELAHDLYSIAVQLDLMLIERIDNTRCARDIQEDLKYNLQTISEHDLREINSYINANQLEKVIHSSKKLNVTSKDRMQSDLNFLLLKLIQSCHSFDSKYRPMQTYIREIGNIFKSQAVADLARRLDEIEKKLSKTFGITFIGLSQRFVNSDFVLIK